MDELITETYKSRVYILTDADNKIIRIEGEYTLPYDLEGWIQIDEGESCDRLNLAQTHYLDKPIFDDNGCHNYKYYRKRIVECTETEKSEELATFPTSVDKQEALEAQIFYTAVMTDTLLEE